VRASRLFFLLACALTSVAACRHSTPPPTLIEQDDSGPADVGPPLDLDSDHDGLCDFSEFQRHTDASDPDTDHDGFSDWVEAQNGSSLLDPTSPDRSWMVTMPEAPRSRIDLPVSIAEYGIGETFTGELTIIAVNYEDDGTIAPTFFTGSDALGATPMSNVRGGIMGSSFLGVLGRTLLQYSVHFEQVQQPLGCMRAFPFAYTIKTGDGQVRGYSQHWLVLLPQGMQIGASGSRWCGPQTVTCI